MELMHGDEVGMPERGEHRELAFERLCLLGGTVEEPLECDLGAGPDSVLDKPNFSGATLAERSDGPEAI